jgi:4-hydroxy-tetrahydrodipicolinate synthase
MPAPYHRLLPRAAGRLAQTGRFLYHKDTCSDPIRSAPSCCDRRTPLGFFNANTPTLLMSLQNGAAGFSPIGANYYPDLYVRLLNAFPTEMESAHDLQRTLSVMEGVASTKYPAAAKRYLGKLGLPIGPRCRVPMPEFSSHDDALLAALMETAA